MTIEEAKKKTCPIMSHWVAGQNLGDNPQWAWSYCLADDCAMWQAFPELWKDTDTGKFYGCDSIPPTRELQPTAGCCGLITKEPA
jgi:hypothetical protein